MRIFRTRVRHLLSRKTRTSPGHPLSGPISDRIRGGKMSKNQDRIPYQGRQSGKSSSRWFGGGGHPRGSGASAGDGRTSNPGILGKIKVVFRPGK